jgi:diaminopimelate decarboxylase
LITRVQVIKTGETKNFAVVDAAMNDLLRPALYSAWQDIVEVNARKDDAALYDVVGPVCETGDFLGKDRELSIDEGDLLAILGAGAYGFVMSSNYNTRPRAAEVLIDKNEAHVIRSRERVKDLWINEVVPSHIGGPVNED